MNTNTEGSALAVEVLLVEDNEQDAALISIALQKTGIDARIRHVDTERQFVHALASPLDIVLADFDVPGFGALRALEVLKAHDVDVPLIVVSGSISEEIAVALLQNGASDYLLKDRLARLGQAVTRVMDERRRRRDKLAVDRALRAAEARMRFALEAARVGVWEADLRSGRQAWSETLEQLHGLTPGSFAGTREAFLARVHPEDVAQVEQALRAVDRSGADADLLYRVTWPDGSLHWLAGLGRTFYDENGNAERAAGIGWDVTERRALEEQYRHSQKMEAVGLLAGGVAHDFNNLLTVIQGFCSLVMESLGPTSPQLPDLLEIKDAAGRAAGLTRQLLAFSRKQHLDPRVMCIGDVVAALQPMLQRLVREDVTITVAGSASGRVRADPGQIEQVIVNLVVNAVDAMPQGGTILIEVVDVDLSEADAAHRVEFKPGPYVMLAITDSGTGMDEATKARIFEPFFTTKPQGSGTGLGLSTVYGIVKQSGGALWVYSEPGRGSTFKIYIPRVDAPIQAAADTSMLPRARGTETILVVEDEESMKRLVGRVLRSSSFDVLIASNPSEAVQIARDHPTPIALLLTDVIMPQMTGPALAKEVLLLRPDMRVLYMSGYTDHAVVQRTGLPPDAPFLQKPFAADALTRKVREVLDAPPSFHRPDSDGAAERG